ncbi:uncharacterized protein LOC122456403 [Dermochelys coriacea]|uniref:uncharacterized protein LOC122456403 n=1 Tax=Dermochelys coriacea TaxID=27794 RepID=UPI001CA9CDFF|nr:uncharacterized protein LOC122456403 [Dermochelys coriacea]
MMLWLPLAFMAAIPRGVHSQIQLVEAGRGVKTTGDSISISCKVSGFPFGNYWMFWYRQVPGKAAEWISYINPDGTNTDYAHSVNGRFSISRDNPSNLLYLQMSGLRPEDSALYHCHRDTVTGRECDHVQKHPLCSHGPLQGKPQVKSQTHTFVGGKNKEKMSPALPSARDGHGFCGAAETGQGWGRKHEAAAVAVPAPRRQHPRVLCCTPAPPGYQRATAPTPALGGSTPLLAALLHLDDSQAASGGGRGPHCFVAPWVLGDLGGFRAVVGSSKRGQGEMSLAAGRSDAAPLTAPTRNGTRLSDLGPSPLTELLGRRLFQSPPGVDS